MNYELFLLPLPQKNHESMTIQDIINRLTPIYDSNEARAIVRQLLEDAFSITYIDACLGALNNLSSEQSSQLDTMIGRLEKGEPVQYVIGKAAFYGRDFHVEPGVLIPRPETEVLITKALELMPSIKGSRSGKRYILDIGCGSGCISTTLALELPDCEVSAWDISDTALRVTRHNARTHGVNVDIYMQDALTPPSNDTALWDLIVSNPPYICNKEARDMHDNVLHHEPHIALFVPDDDPLLFYRSIATYATHALRHGGALIFEINEAYGKETLSLLFSLGFTDAHLTKDQYGKDRIISARI